MSLKKKATLGVIWTFINSFFLKGSTFFVSLFLARTLGPEAFGIMGMITVFFYLGNAIIDSGLSESLIRYKGADNQHFSTIFYANFFISLIIYTLIFIIAPFVAKFFAQEVLTDIIRVYCVSFVFSSFYAVQQAKLGKELNFKKITMLESPSYITGGIIGIVLGLSGYGVWSLVYMHLSIHLFRGFSFFFFSGWSPSFIFQLSILKTHYSFGYKLMLSAVIDTIFNHIYNIVIGKSFSVVTLGNFERANSVNSYPVRAITSIINKVTFPLLSELQGEPEKLSKIYKKLVKFSFFIIAPLMLGLGALSEPIFNLVLGPDWSEAIIYFKVLCLSSIFYPVHAFNVNIFKVFGRSDLFLKLVIIKKSLVIITVFIALNFGIMALLWGSLVSSIISLFINGAFNKKLINYTPLQQIWDILPTLINSIIMAFLVDFSLSYFTDLNYFIQIIIGILIGGGVFIGINFIYKPEPFNIIINSIKHRKLVIN